MHDQFNTLDIEDHFESYIIKQTHNRKNQKYIHIYRYILNGQFSEIKLDALKEVSSAEILKRAKFDRFNIFVLVTDIYQDQLYYCVFLI